MPEDIDLFKQLWEAAKTAGLFGTMLMFFVWYRTDAERRKLLDGRDDLLERCLATMQACKDATKEVATAVYMIDRSGRVRGELAESRFQEGRE